jgi:signal transduction histidine kinase
MFSQYFKSRRKGDLSECTRIQYLIIAIFIGNFGAIDFIPMQGIKLHFFGFIFMIFMVSIFAYAIVRHKLLNIEVIIKKTIIFGGLFAAAYAVLTYLALFMQSGFERFLITHKVSRISPHATPWPILELFGLTINIFSVPPLMVSSLTILLGIYVYLKNRKETQNITYFYLCTSISLWLFFASMLFSCSGDKKLAVFLAKMIFLGVTFIPITFYHFVVSFLKIKNQGNIIKAVYLTGIIFLVFLFFTDLYISGVNRFFWGYYPKAGIFHPLDILLFMSLYGYALWLLYRKVKTEKVDLLQKQRIKYALVSFFIAAFAALDYLPNYGYCVYPFGYITIFTMLSIFAYAIVRHKLLDIEVIIKKTLIFGGLFTVVYAVFAFFALLGQVFFEKFVTQNRWVAMVPSVLVVTVALRPLENFLVFVTDRYLFQKRYDYKELVKTFTSEVLTVLELDRLIELTQKRLTDIMKITGCCIALGRQPAPFAAQASVPIVFQDNDIGTLLLGRKKSDEDYTQDDLDILQPLSRALGIAVSNARLFEDLTKAQARMAEKDKMATIGTLAAGIAHEIRNPITTIRNFADYLPEKYADGSFVDRFNKLVPAEIGRVESIARSLLEFSSGEEGGEAEEFGVDEPVRAAISILEPQYRNLGVRIRCGYDQKHFIRSNKTVLQDAIFNMMNYILAEMGEGGEIAIDCAQDRDGLSLCVRSRDIVVADHIIKDVFEPVSGLYREKRGFGFNLFMAKQLLERAGADFSISSDKRSGSEFRIRFRRNASV